MVGFKGEEEEQVCLEQGEEGCLMTKYAGVLVTEAIQIRETTFAQKNRSATRIKAYEILHSPFLRFFMYLVIIVDLSLPFYEPIASQVTKNDREKRQLISMAIELGVMLILSLHSWLQVYVVSKETFFQDPWKMIKVGLIALTVVEIVGWSWIVAAWGFYSWRVSRFFRSFFLIEQGDRLQFIFMSTCRTILRIKDVFLFLFVFLLFFTSIGFFLFSDQGEEGADYFGTFDEAFMSLFILLTTANFPDVMLPYYREHSYNVIYFILFIVFGLYLILNMIFASIYNHYRCVNIEKINQYLNIRHSLLAQAFECLDKDNDGRIDIFTWNNLLNYVRPDLKKDQATILFAMVDENHKGYLEEPEFLEICSFLDLEVKKNRLYNENGTSWIHQKAASELNPELSWSSQTEEEAQVSMSYRDSLTGFSDSDFEFNVGLNSEFAPKGSINNASSSTPLLSENPGQRRSRPSTPAFIAPPANVKWYETVQEWCYVISSSKPFEYIVLFLVIFLTALTVGQSYFKCYREEENPADRCGWLLFTFGCICTFFVFELILKLIGFGPHLFFSNTWNCVDAFTIIAAEIGVLCEMAFALNGMSTTTHIAEIISGLRLLKLFAISHRFQVIIDTFLGLLPPLVPYLAVLLSIYYVWAIIGMELYAGKLVEGNPRLHGTDYDTLNYYCNNFNNYGRALVTLFELMVVNNWQVTMFGVVAVTSKWSQLYFVFFYLVTVMVVMNLILAFIVEAFVTRQEENTRSNSWERELLLSFHEAQLIVIGRAKYTISVPKRLFRLYLDIFLSSRVDSDQEETTPEQQNQEKEQIDDLYKKLGEEEKKARGSTSDIDSEWEAAETYMMSQRRGEGMKQRRARAITMRVMNALGEQRMNSQKNPQEMFGESETSNTPTSPSLAAAPEISVDQPDLTSKKTRTNRAMLPRALTRSNAHNHFTGASTRQNMRPTSPKPQQQQTFFHVSPPPTRASSMRAPNKIEKPEDDTFQQEEVRATRGLTQRWGEKIRDEGKAIRGFVPSLPSAPNLRATPSLPEGPSLPSLPDGPSLPSLPDGPSLPSLPDGPSLPSLPDGPSLPSLPDGPSLPAAPSLPSVTLPFTGKRSRSARPESSYVMGSSHASLSRPSSPRSSTPPPSTSVSSPPLSSSSPPSSPHQSPPSSPSSPSSPPEGWSF